MDVHHTVNSLGELTRTRGASAPDYGRSPSGKNSSFTLFDAISGGVPESHGLGAVLPGAYNDSIGCQTASTLSVNKSPMSKSVTLPLSCGKLRTKLPKLKPS